MRQGLGLPRYPAQIVATLNGNLGIESDLMFNLPGVPVFILTTAAMIIQGYTNVQMFQAQARLEINDERSTAVPGLQNDQNTYYEDPEPYFQTQYKILKGRDLTRRVVRKLHLETVPEFNGTAAPPQALI